MQALARLVKISGQPSNPTIALMTSRDSVLPVASSPGKAGVYRFRQQRLSKRSVSLGPFVNRLSECFG